MKISPYDTKVEKNELTFLDPITNGLVAKSLI